MQASSDSGRSNSNLRMHAVISRVQKEYIGLALTRGKKNGKKNTHFKRCKGEKRGAKNKEDKQ